MSHATIGAVQVLGRALATMALYDARHPARAQAIDATHEALVDALASDGALRLSFLDGSVVAGATLLDGLPRWEWGERLAAAGVQRLEVGDAPPPSRDDVAALLDALRERLAAPATLPATWLRGTIRMGPLGITEPGAVASVTPSAGAPSVAPVGAGHPLADEAALVAWCLAEVRTHGRVPLAEASAAVHALAATARDEGDALPLVVPVRAGDYATTHAVNVAVLAMRVADRLGARGDALHATGLAALLHDVGMLRVDPALLDRRAPLAPHERAEVARHPLLGARLLLAAGADPLCATVAAEHHRHADGTGGYPALDGVPHLASRLVQCCDVYDAMCTTRPWRTALASDAALALMARAAGTQLDATLVRVFLRTVTEATFPAGDAVSA